MGILDGPLQGVAKNLIEKFGQDAVLKEVITGVFQTTSLTVGNTPIEHPVKAIVPQKVSREGRTLMKAGDQVHLVAAASLGSKVPTTDWLLVPPGSAAEREIVTVTSVMVSDGAAMYEIVSRGV